MSLLWRLLRAVVVVLGVSTVIIFALPVMVYAPTAQAHAFVIGSDPVDGSTVATVPRMVHIYFNATISSMSTARIYAAQNGDLVDVTATPGIIPPGKPQQLDVPLKSPQQLSQGSYEVRWAAVALDDGHTTNGIIGFNVGVSSTGLSGTPTLGPSTSNNLDNPGGSHVIDFTGGLLIAWDWLALLALMLWIGILVTERLIVSGIGRTSIVLERARERASALHGLCLLALLFGEVVTLVLRTSLFTHTLGQPFQVSFILQFILNTNYGILLIVRVALLLIALGVLFWARRAPASQGVAQTTVMQHVAHTGSVRRINSQELHVTGPLKNITRERNEQPYVATVAPRSSRYSTLAWLAIAGLVLLTRVMSGDVAAIAQPHFSAIVMGWLYFAVLGSWLGSLAYLAYLLLPQLLVIERDYDADLLVILQRRFAPFHLACMAILLVSGLFVVEMSMPSVQLFLTDPYGRTLLLQIGLLAIMLIIELYVLVVIRPKLIRQSLLLPVVDPELPARRARQTTIEQTGRRLRLVVGIQVWLGVAALLCTALLAYFAPPIVFPNVSYTNTAQTGGTTITGSLQTQQVGDLSVTLQVVPSRIDSANSVILVLYDRNGQPIENARIQLSTNMEAMDMGTTQATITGDTGVYATTFARGAAFSMAGAWDIDVNIQRPQQQAVKLRFRVMLQ